MKHMKHVCLYQVNHVSWRLRFQDFKTPTKERTAEEQNFKKIILGLLVNTTKCAIKKLKNLDDGANILKSEQAKEDFRAETKVLKKINHPNLVQVIFFETSLEM